MNQQDNQQLINDLVAERVEPQTAARLVRDAPDVCQRQLSYLDYQDEQDDRAATLVASIEGDWPEPARSYWANAAKRTAEEKQPAADPPQPATSTPTDNANEEQEAPEPEEDVRNLLAALESIAVMSHAHRGDEESGCPVCVAWEALKQWAHQRSVRGG